MTLGSEDPSDHEDQGLQGAQAVGAYLEDVHLRLLLGSGPWHGEDAKARENHSPGDP